MGKRRSIKSARQQAGARRLLRLAVVLVALLLGAMVVHRDTLRGWYYSRLPLDRLAERAGEPSAPRQLVEAAAARLLAAGRPAAARQILEPHLEQWSDQAAYRIMMGRAYMATGAPREAYGNFQVAGMLRPKDAEAHWWLGEIRREQGRTEDAAEHYRRVTELEPERGEAWQRLGARALKLNQYEDALALLNRAEERGPTGEVTRLRARALWKLGRLDEAQAAARQAAAHEPAPASLLVLGQVLAASPRAADWREAAASLQRAVAQEPRNDEARRELGLVYRQLGEHRKAIRELRAHLRLNPGAARSYLPLAQSYQALGKPELAARVLRIYRRLEPIEIKTAQAEYRVLASREAPKARLALALTYAACGFEDRARQELQALLRTHPDHVPATKLLARLPDRRSLVIEPLPPDPEAGP